MADWLLSVRHSFGDQCGASFLSSWMRTMLILSRVTASVLGRVYALTFVCITDVE